MLQSDSKSLNLYKDSMTEILNIILMGSKIYDNNSDSPWTWNASM